jgi:glycerol uptake facilitator-like aquaporin
LPDAGSREPVIRRAVVEALGTAGLVFAGAGAIVVNEVSGGSIGHLGISLTFGMIVAAMIYSTGHISGAHINPAVTLAFALVRRLSFRDAGVY